MKPLHPYLKDIQQLCEQYKVKCLYAFGSVVAGNFHEESDYDFIVAFEPLNPEQYADNYFNLKFALEGLLKRPVDLLEEKTIKNPFFKTTVENQRQLIYAR